MDAARGKLTLRTRHESHYLLQQSVELGDDGHGRTAYEDSALAPSMANGSVVE